LRIRDIERGIRLRSDIELSFAKGIQVGEPDVDLISATETFFGEISCDAVLKPTSYGWYKYALLDHDQIYLRWDGMFEFLVDGDGRRLWFGSLGTNSLESLQVYLLGRALSFALVKQGFEPLHSTAIVLDGEALAFLGESGYGKSSLAAGFLGDGYRLLTDDLLVLHETGGRLLAYPGPPRIKLFPKVAARFLSAMMHRIHSGPGAPFGFLRGNAAALITLFDVLGLAFLFVSVLRLFASWHDYLLVALFVKSFLLGAK